MRELELGTAFGGLTRDQVDTILSNALEQTLLEGDELFAEGDEGGSLFVVDSGRVEVYKTIREGVDRVLTTVGSGGVVGELSFLDGSRRSAGARATTPTDMRMLTRPVFDAFAAEHPEIAAAFHAGLAQVMAERVRLANNLYRDAVAAWLEATHLDALGLHHLAGRVRLVNVHLTTGTTIQGRAMEFSHQPSGWALIIKDEAEHVSHIPYHAVVRVEVVP